MLTSNFLIILLTMISATRFTKKNLNDLMNMSSKKKGTNQLSDRDQLIHFIVSDKIGSQVTVRLYNSEVELTYKEKLIYVKKRFRRLLSNLKKSNNKDDALKKVDESNSYIKFLNDYKSRQFHILRNFHHCH